MLTPEEATTKAFAAAEIALSTEKIATNVLAKPSEIEAPCTSSAAAVTAVNSETARAIPGPDKENSLSGKHLGSIHTANSDLGLIYNQHLSSPQFTRKPGRILSPNALALQYDDRD